MSFAHEDEYIQSIHDEYVTVIDRLEQAERA